MADKVRAHDATNNRVFFICFSIYLVVFSGLSGDSGFSGDSGDSGLSGVFIDFAGP
jgi:hypothetical protein